MVNPLEELFPGLARKGYQITSPKSKRYNCMAWAAGDVEKWWWPVPLEVNEVYWPAGAAREETGTAFQAAFASLGYVISNGEGHETGFEKVAFFAEAEGPPLHAARQLPSGKWTSKLGEMEDIEHDLRDLEGDAYGTVVLIMKRPVPSSS